MFAIQPDCSEDCASRGAGVSPAYKVHIREYCRGIENRGKDNRDIENSGIENIVEVTLRPSRRYTFRKQIIRF